MTGRGRRIAVAVLALFAVFAVDAAAQCKRGEVLVGQDANYYYCKEKKEYAACVKNAGEALRASNPACARTVEQCFKDEKKNLNTAAATCVLGCLGSQPMLPGCLAACGVAGIYATASLERCTNTFDNCFTAALGSHQRRIEACGR